MRVCPGWPRSLDSFAQSLCLKFVSGLFAYSVQLYPYTLAAFSSLIAIVLHENSAPVISARRPLAPLPHALLMAGLVMSDSSQRKRTGGRSF